MINSHSIDLAKQLLKQAGYTVTPPPEPLKGKVYVFRNKAPAPKGEENEIFIRAYNFCLYSDTHDLIAIVDWEEGQGL